jgi:AraC-like DNA-binding protein
VSLQLVRQSESRTHDLDEGITATRAAFGDGVEIAPPERGGTEVAIRYLHTPDLTSIRWRMSGAATGSRSHDDEERAIVLTGVVVNGGLSLRTGGRDGIDVTRPFLYPDFVESKVDAPDLANLAVAQEVVDAQARTMALDDRHRVRFIGTAPVTPALDRIWRNTMAYTNRVMGELVDQPAAGLAATGLVELVVTQLLHVFPNTALEVEVEHGPGAAGQGTRAMRRALTYIDDNLDQAFSLAELAEASGLSLRGLHAAFQREMETTPRRFIRRSRLSAARADLRREDETTSDVPAIAMRWGFANVALFSRHYRDSFAEDPEDTLRA